jgi:hypothetical protein
MKVDGLASIVDVQLTTREQKPPLQERQFQWDCLARAAQSPSQQCRELWHSDQEGESLRLHGPSPRPSQSPSQDWRPPPAA